MSTIDSFFKKTLERAGEIGKKRRVKRLADEKYTRGLTERKFSLQEDAAESADETSKARIENLKNTSLLAQKEQAFKQGPQFDLSKERLGFEQERAQGQQASRERANEITARSSAFQQKVAGAKIGLERAKLTEQQIRTTSAINKDKAQSSIDQSSLELNKRKASRAQLKSKRTMLRNAAELGLDEETIAGLREQVQQGARQQLYGGDY